jgi:GxxExxY protein
MDLNPVTRDLVDSAYRVHRALGPGLLESVYEAALAFELGKRGHRVGRQVGIPVVYEGVRIQAGFFEDLVVDEGVIVEVKAPEGIAPEGIAPVHRRQ